MFQATVYRIMFGSPSDIQGEINTAFDVLNHWNSLHSEQSKIVLLPLHWSISSYPAMGKHPQKILDKQVVEKSDLLICIFGTRLGTPTDTEISGTIEEIKEHRKAGKDVMVFFKLSVDDITSVDPQQLQYLNDFKESIRDDALWWEFSNSKDFKNKLSDAVQRYVIEHWTGSNIVENGSGSSTKIEFSEDEKQLLTDWSKSRNANCYTIGILGGTRYVFGNYQFDAKDGRTKVEVDDFIDRLQIAGFIAWVRDDDRGKPIYQLKKAAYDYVDSITEKEN